MQHNSAVSTTSHKKKKVKLEKAERKSEVMAETRRVFVQQATLVGAQQLQMSPPVMAFVAPEDSWLMIVNELVMVRTWSSNNVLLACVMECVLSACCCVGIAIGGDVCPCVCDLYMIVCEKWVAVLSLCIRVCVCVGLSYPIDGVLKLAARSQPCLTSRVYTWD